MFDTDIEQLALDLEKKYDDLGKALTAYNAGDGGAYKYYFSKGIYANDYAKKIIKNKDKFKILED